MNRIRQLTTLGQSVWLDFTQRSFVASGELRRLIEQCGVSGVTSNPAIFDQAITETSDYTQAIEQAARRGYLSRDTYEQIIVQDIKAVADELLGVFGHKNRHDGFVSLEVAPHFARDTNKTMVQAHDFWHRVGRPNLMIKVPGTMEGLASIRQLIADGINVNITLLFGLKRYAAVAEAYMSGLEDRLARNQPIEHIFSVASFFISRIDLHVDPLLTEPALQARHPANILALKGQAGIAYARKAFEQYTRLFQSERFKRLRAQGAKPQHLLWASTGTKNPNERDVRYVEALVGPETITTLSRPTLEAFIHHGEASVQLPGNLGEADAVVRCLGDVGIDLEAVAAQLEEEGIQKFTRSFDHLMSELERKLAAARKSIGKSPQPNPSPATTSQALSSPAGEANMRIDNPHP
ncbi:MAG: transaldolase [Nibricoccus sp.]